MTNLSWQLFPNSGSHYDPRITGLIVTAVAALVALQCGARTLAGQEGKVKAGSKPETIDEYIATFPPDVQAILQKIRASIAKAIPTAQEKISYRIPAFVLDGDIIYFAAFKKHIGIFPPVRDPKLKKEVARYAGPKGNLQLPLAERIPYGLIGRIAKVRAKENAARVAAKSKRK